MERETRTKGFELAANQDCDLAIAQNGYWGLDYVVPRDTSLSYTAPSCAER